MTPTPENTFTLTGVAHRPGNCPECGGPGFFRADVPPGHPQFGKPIRCNNPWHAPERLARLAALSNLAEGDLSVRLSDIQANEHNREILQAARDMITRPEGWLFLWGGPGNAKTEILIAVVNEVNSANKGPAMYCTFSNLVNWITDAFRDDAGDSYIQRFQRVLDIKLLAIDEMDKARSTEFADEFRFHFLDERYRQAIRGETAIVFSGNTNPNTLPLPLYDRVRDGRFRIVHNTAPSARPLMRR